MVRPRGAKKYGNSVGVRRWMSATDEKVFRSKYYAVLVFLSLCCTPFCFSSTRGRIAPSALSKVRSILLIRGRSDMFKTNLMSTWNLSQIISNNANNSHNIFKISNIKKFSLQREYYFFLVKIFPFTSSSSIRKQLCQQIWVWGYSLRGQRKHIEAVGSLISFSLLLLLLLCALWV